MDGNESTFLKAVREGIVGFVLKDASAAEVAAAIRGVAAGEAVCPAPLCMSLFRLVAQQMFASPSPSGTTDFGLSPREQQMVELLRERLTNKQIAARLSVSEQTVKNHVHNMLRKLGVPNRSAIVARCASEGSRPSAA
jgi:DNA-binding NarL/FixJ family response regulator